MAAIGCGGKSLRSPSSCFGSSTVLGPPFEGKWLPLSVVEKVYAPRLHVLVLQRFLGLLLRKNGRQSLRSLSSFGHEVWEVDIWMISNFSCLWRQGSALGLRLVMETERERSV